MCGSWGRASRRQPLRAIGYCVPRIQTPQPSIYLLMPRLPATVAFALAGSLQPSTSNEALFLGAWQITHTACYIPDQREYCEIFDIFWPDGVPAGHRHPPTRPVRRGAELQLAAAVSALTDRLQRP